MKISKIFIPIIIAISICVGMVVSSFVFNHSKYGFIQNNTNRFKLNKLIDIIENNYVDSVNTDSIIDLTVNDILNQLDPHSFYIPSNKQQTIAENMNGEFVGIGITYYMLNDTLAVVNAIEGGPSIKAGIKSGDRILFANERKLYGEKISTDTLMNILKGEKQSQINLKVYRKTENKILNFNFHRNTVPVKSVDIALKIKDNLGYIKINRFAASTYKEFKNALNYLTKQNVDTFILDFRNNGGGYVEIADKMIAEFLLENDIIVRLISKAGTEEQILATKTGNFAESTLYVLVDENSASASEIFAGAIQDNDRGLIIGRRTFGKGLVQQDMSLGDGSSIRLTVSKYHTPSGRPIQKPYTLGNLEYENDYGKRLSSGELYSKDSIKIIDSITYKTKNGNSIFAGQGGIIPDIFVPLPKNHIETELKYVMNSAFMSNFIFQVIDEDRDFLNKESFDDLVTYLENTDVYYIKIKNYLKAYPLNFNPDKYKSILKKYITAEIIRQVKSEYYYYMYKMQYEDEIIKIIEIHKNTD